MRNYQVDYSRYSFKTDDDWGDYYNGEYREGSFSKDGYCWHTYYCTDGKTHTMYEHIAKWEYFNGKIPEGMVVDHIIPVERSEYSHTNGTNRLDNLRILTVADNNRNKATRKNMSEAKKGEKNPIYGTKRSETTKKKISEANSKQLYQYSTDEKLVRIWPNAKEVEKELGIKRSNISACCYGKIKSAGGYIWSHEPL